MTHPRAALLLACSMTCVAACASTPSGGQCAPGTVCDASAITGEDGPPGGDLGTPQALAIAPANPTLVVTDLAMLPSLALTANVTYGGGAVAATPASWTLDRYDIASIDASSGTLTAAGTAFGSVIVTATALGLTATTTVDVQLMTSVNAGGAVSPGDVTKLTGATGADPAVTAFAYPYDRTVFPRGLLPPEQMWNGGAAGDAYSIHLTAPSFDLTIYTTADPPSRYTLSTTLWNALTTTAAGKDVSSELHRLSGGTAYVSATQSWKIADANLRGTIYYWAINQGQLVKLDLPTGTATPLIDPGPNTALDTPVPLSSGSPASPPWEDNGHGKRCVACHAVSKDGSTLSAAFSSGSSAGPAGFVNLATSSITAISDYTQQGGLNALTPDGKLAVMNNWDKTMKLLDASTGQVVASALDAQTAICDPTFSPDGSLFAMAASCGTAGSGNLFTFTTSNLVIADFAQATHAFSNQRTVLTSTGAGDAIGYPSFSPDSKWIIHQRGDYIRGKIGDVNHTHGNDDLFIVRAEAGATSIALDNANGKGVLPADSAHLNYAPTVNPIAEGGYTWVVFTSPRDYGNRMVSPAGAAPADATYSNRKQLWVSAVDATPGTTDPSHPGFWLPGQDMNSANMFGYWALAPCKATAGDAGAQSCSAGFECCSGFCRDTGAGPMCVDVPSGCHQVGERCTTATDCCNAGSGVICAAGICQNLVN